MTVRRFSLSEAKAFRRCRRAWWLQYVRRLRWPKVETGALSLGTTTHEGMEHLYDRGGLDVALRRIGGFAAQYLDEVDDKEAWLKQAQDAQNFLVGYVEWLEETGADQRYEHIASEVELEMPLVEIDDVQWVLMGKLDHLVYDRLTKKRRYMDFKTVQSFQQIIQDAPRNEQFPTYDLLMQANNEEPCLGGIWRMIRKVQRAQESKNGEPFFMDYERPFNPRRIEVQRMRMIALAHEMHEAEQQLQGEHGYRDVHQLVVPPTPDFRCNWDCEFRLPCDSFDEGERVEDMIDDLYVVSDPYARYRSLGRREET